MSRTIDQEVEFAVLEGFYHYNTPPYAPLLMMAFVLGAFGWQAGFLYSLPIGVLYCVGIAMQEYVVRQNSWLGSGDIEAANAWFRRYLPGATISAFAWGLIPILGIILGDTLFLMFTYLVISYTSFGNLSERSLIPRAFRQMQFAMSGTCLVLMGYQFYQTGAVIDLVIFVSFALALQFLLVQGRLRHENETARIRANIEARLAREELAVSHAALQEAYKELEFVASRDGLTGLFNRRQLDTLFEQECSRASRYGSAFSILVADLDHFKAINDQFGHQVGDKVLIGVARELQEMARETDAVGRWGGEEFLLLCPETGIAEAEALAGRIVVAVAGLEFGHISKVTCSLGVATWQPGDNCDSLLRRADAALYRAKERGRNQYATEQGSNQD